MNYSMPLLKLEITLLIFDAANVSHELAMYGEGNCDIEKLIADLKKLLK